MSTVLLLAGIALATLAACLVWVVRVVTRMIDGFQPPDTPSEASFEALWKSLEELEDRTKDAIAKLTQAVANGIDHVDRNEKRVRGIVVGAKRRFEAEGYVDPGVDAEADTLPLVHEPGGEGEHLPTLSDGVEASPNPFQGIPGTLPLGWRPE